MNTAPRLELKKRFSQIETKYEHSTQSLWTILSQNNIIPNANPILMQELYAHHININATGGLIQTPDNDEQTKLKFSVLSSITDGHFNVGGDLEVMLDAINKQDYALLKGYAYKSLEVIAQRALSFNLNEVITISLVRGVCIGAGIEAALTSDIVIAEDDSTYMFPEALFNMIPGMGAHTFISRRANARVADRMIRSGDTYSAQDMLNMGLVDIVVEKGYGEKAVYDFMRNTKNSFQAELSMKKARNIIHPITKEELFSIVDVWVDNALNLTPRDTKMMARFISTQRKRFNIIDTIATNEDIRFAS